MGHPAPGLNQQQAHAAAEDRGGSFDGIELDFIVFGVEEPVEMSAAGAHAAGHLGFGEALLGYYDDAVACPWNFSAI